MILAEASGESPLQIQVLTRWMWEQRRSHDARSATRRYGQQRSEKPNLLRARCRFLSIIPNGLKELAIRNHAPSEVQGVEHDEERAWRHLGSDFVVINEIKPPSRIELARERMLLCRLYLGLIHSINDDYGAAFAAHSDSSSLRAIGIYVFLRTVMCSPVHPSAIARALKLPRTTVLRRLEEMVKHGFVEHVGNAYRVTDKVNIPDLQEKLQRRIAMIADTAKRLAEFSAS